MKLLKVKVPLGYKMLAKGFEIDFLTKTRVEKDDSNEELLNVGGNLLYPVETVLIGKNSSGKTTTLSLIHLVLSFLRTGRIQNGFLPDGESFRLHFVFFRDGSYCRYEGQFKKEMAKNESFLVIEEESFGTAFARASYRKDLSNVVYVDDPSFTPNVGGDTSNITRFAQSHDFNVFIDELGYSSSLYSLYYNVLGEKAFSALLHLFDDSVSSIVPNIEDGKSRGYRFKRAGDPSPMIVENSYLESVLSAGTLRGINLYGASILAFMTGGTILVDEIEKSFSRNLIENLFLMFGDKTINKGQASIVYTTHYSELLDHNSRCDNVNVLHRIGNEITLKNMKADYDQRTDMLKSSQFDQNVFDTLINYESLMELKDAIRERR